MTLLAPFLVILFVVACSGLSTESITDTFQDAVKFENRASESNSAPKERSSRGGCRGADLLEEIDAEYAANQFRAETLYAEKRMCVKGTITEFWEGSSRHGLALLTSADVAPNATFIIRGDLNTEDSQAKWTAWLMGKSVGDTIEAECLYNPGRPESWYSGKEESVFLAFHDCQLRE